MARAKYIGRFSETMRREGEKPTEEKPTQRGPEPLQRVRERLVKEALGVHCSPLGIKVDRGSLPAGRKGIKIKVEGSKPRRK